MYDFYGRGYVILEDGQPKEIFVGSRIGANERVDWLNSYGEEEYSSSALSLPVYREMFKDEVDFRDGV